MEEILLSQYSLYPQTVSFSVVTFNVVTSCVLFDDSVNCENEWDFVIRDFIAPTKVVYCPVILTIMKLLQVFVNSLPSHCAINLQIMEKIDSQKILCDIRKQKKNVSSDGELWDILS